MTQIEQHLSVRRGLNRSGFAGDKQTINAVIVACLSLIAGPVAYAALGAPGFFGTVAVTIICTIFLSSTAFVIFSILICFQNIFISIWAPLSLTKADLDVIRGASFLVAAVTACFCIGTIYFGARSKTELRRCLDLSVLVLMILVVFLVYGAISAGTFPAAVYFRNLSTFPIYLSIASLPFLGGRRPPIEKTYFALFIFVLLYGYCELFARDQLYSLLNVNDYIAIKYGEAYDNWAKASITSLFNTPFLGDLTFRILRLEGPMLHSVSYGYALAILALPLVIKRPVFALALQMPLQALASSKGAALMLGVSCLISLCSRYLNRFSARFLFSAAIIAVVFYVGLGIFVGLSYGDFHVIGLLGGVEGFFSNPIGHGLGAGGNLSVDAITIDTWQTAQRAGAADYGVESAIGVMLYQIGVFTFLIVALVLYAALLCLRRKHIRGLVYGSSLIVLLANSFFQEEALFAPASIGLLGMLVGVYLTETTKPSEGRLPKVVGGMP